MAVHYHYPTRKKWRRPWNYRWDRGSDHWVIWGCFALLVRYKPRRGWFPQTLLRLAAVDGLNVLAATLGDRSEAEVMWEC